MTRPATISAALSILLVFAAVAADAQTAAPDGEWEYQIAPFFLWGLSLDGEMTVRGQAQDVKMDFDEILDATEALFTVHFEAWNGGWGVFVEGSYIGLSDRLTTEQLTLDIDMDLLLVEFGGMSAVAEELAVLWGVRYVGLDPVINISGPVGIEPTIDEKQGWMDPIVGFVWRPSIGDRWYFAGRLDVGGFGFQSDLVWNAAALFAYRLKPSIDLIFGYRAMDYDFEDEQNDFGFDALLSGPVVAANFRF